MRVAPCSQPLDKGIVDVLEGLIRRKDLSLSSKNCSGLSSLGLVRQYDISCVSLKTWAEFQMKNISCIAFQEST